MRICQRMTTVLNITVPKPPQISLLNSRLSLSALISFSVFPGPRPLTVYVVLSVWEGSSFCYGWRWGWWSQVAIREVVAQRRMGVPLTQSIFYEGKTASQVYSIHQQMEWDISMYACTWRNGSPSEYQCCHAIPSHSRRRQWGGHWWSIPGVLEDSCKIQEGRKVILICFILSTWVKKNESGSTNTRIHNSRYTLRTDFLGVTFNESVCV